ncbi:MAG TPA: adenylosuccinate synthase [Candidatus Fraserbacteria bacterium]|nr:adenylosuccinate synthase [Candidatus Fraserbacteria bacterium]
MPGIAVLGAQWGDEGKGKIVHLLSKNADMAVRFNGGTNAGHTVVFNPDQADQAGESEFRFHLIPSGALHPNCVGVLGNGMVIEPFALAAELRQLSEQLGQAPRIWISQNAHMILPYHPIVERLEGATSELDTTAKGIGPAYRDKTARHGIRTCELRSPGRFQELLAQNLARERAIFPDSQELQELDPAKLTEQILAATDGMRDRLTDTSLLINRALDEGRAVVFEGAQGCLLDIDFGTYPYVTSSSATIGGVGVGAGVSPRRLERVIGVAKAYATRVGAGPFPTEETEALGRRLREQGHEYGTTTGRPRRCGWLDLVALRYAVRLNGLTELALTKLDVLSGLDQLQVTVAYRREGERLTEFPTTLEELSACEPSYQSLPGWSERLESCRSFSDLPPSAQRYVRFIEEQLELPVGTISVGPSFHDTIRIAGG